MIMQHPMRPSKTSVGTLMHNNNTVENFYIRTPPDNGGGPQRIRDQWFWSSVAKCCQAKCCHIPLSQEDGGLPLPNHSSQICIIIPTYR